ncbi:MAG TPA: OFA family MFS transporter [Bacillota bacterium]|nr:OFA family MFS transporter [Bacillota bacterium]
METKNKGKLVLASAIGINLMGGMLYSWSVFAAALVKELGYTKTQAQIPYTIALAMLALLSVPGGKIYDRFGPRVCTTAMGILCGTGLILSGFSNSIPLFALAFGLICGAGLGISYAATTPAAVKWFAPQKRGLITGLVVAGVGLASVYVAPMTQYFISNFGVKQAFWMEGIIFGIGILILSQFISNPPAGYVPAGVAAPSVAGAGASSKREYTTLEMMGTSQFWRIWFIYVCGAMAGLMIIGHMALIAKIQANVGWAFIFVAILAIFNASGRVVGGVLSDKIGRTKTLLAMFILQGVNMALFSNYTSIPLLVFGIACTGIGYGSLLAVFPPLTFDYFGLKNGGTNYGVVFTAWGVAGVIGPIMAGRIADATKSYSTAYMVAAGFLVLAAVTVLTLKAPKEAADTKPVIAAQLK